MTRVLCALADIPDPGSRAVAAAADERHGGAFVVRRGATVWGYVNRCPHTGAPLDMLPDRFLDMTATLIQCASHGAQFERDTGACVRGPCAGRALTPFPVQVRDGLVVTAA